MLFSLQKFAREKKLIVDSSEIFKIVGRVITNLEKLKRNYNKRKLTREIKKLADMSVTGMNYIEINQDIYNKGEMCGQEATLLKFRDLVLKNLGRVD